MRIARIGAGLVLSGLLLASISGCEQAADPGVKLDSLPATGPGGGPPPQSQQQYYEAQKKAQGENPYGQGYPGGSNAPAR